MSVTTTGVHEDSVPENRLRNKQILLVDYAEVFDIDLEADETSRETAFVTNVRIHKNDASFLDIKCNVAVPYSMFAIFDAKYFNQLIKPNRYQAFKNLVDFINRGH